MIEDTMSDKRTLHHRTISGEFTHGCQSISVTTSLPLTSAHLTVHTATLLIIMFGAQLNNLNMSGKYEWKNSLFLHMGIALLSTFTVLYQINIYLINIDISHFNVSIQNEYTWTVARLFDYRL